MRKMNLMTILVFDFKKVASTIVLLPLTVDLLILKMYNHDVEINYHSMIQMSSCRKFRASHILNYTRALPESGDFCIV